MNPDGLIGFLGIWPSAVRFRLKRLSATVRHHECETGAKYCKVLHEQVAPNSLVCEVFIEITDIADKTNAAKKDSLVKEASLGNLLAGHLSNIALPAKPVRQFRLFFEFNTMTASGSL